jgi:hypothetical protein
MLLWGESAMTSTLAYLFAIAVVSQLTVAPTDVGIETTVTDNANPGAAPPITAQNSGTSLPALTPVDIEILTALNSKTSKMGEFFDIRLAEPVILDGKIVIPAGAVGKGEVIHAAKARAAGKAGELILAARYIEDRGQKIRLRSFKFGESTGISNRDRALIAGALIAVPMTLLISGGNVNVPAGTRAQAKTSEINELLLQKGM